MEIEKTIVIARPVKEVWAFVAEARNDPRWCKKVESVDQVAGDGPGPDARYRVIHRPIRLKKPKELAVTVEEYSPPSRLRLREEDDDGVFNVTYELEPVAEGTRITPARPDRVEDPKGPVSDRAPDGQPRHREPVRGAEAPAGGRLIARARGHAGFEAAIATLNPAARSAG
jgi:uncharacterized protein YndB with AHSA1/START domain